MTTSMESMCKAILRELGYVREKQARGATRRHLEAGESADAVLACYRRIQGHLQRLSLNANLSMWKIVDEHGTDTRLDRMCPSLSACYNSRQATELKRGACTPGTRVNVLGQALSWVRSRALGSIYWLNGMAGTGKTTIAYSLCEELDAAHNLGASFFCSRLLPECRDVNQIVPSIAYQLARFSRPFRTALSRVLEIERDVHTQLLRIQFETLVVKPLLEVADTLPEDLVVVIDALDECDDKESTGQILEALLIKTFELPIKFFIASRPEPEIRDQMRAQDRRTVLRLVLHELDTGTVQGDIEVYLKAALKPIAPSESEIAILVQRAGILFIYAATAVRYIGYDKFSRNPRSRMRSILGISSNISISTDNRTYKEIDELYSVILEAAIDDPGLNDRERDEMKQVLYTVLCAREPLTTCALSGLLGLDIGQVQAALRPLWSVLHLAESSDLITTLHASFTDYMFHPNRSRGYYCEPETQNHILARCCFNRIKGAKPQFNICELKSSYVLDAHVSDLGSRVEKAISPELSYACRNWAAHLERAKRSSELTDLVEDFLSARLLLWMEIMNLKKYMDAGVGVMRQAEEWCTHQLCSEELRRMMHDAWRFVAAFTSSSVSQSTPHIYVSMLPCWPESSPIAEKYSKRFQVPVVAQGSAIAQRRLEHLATWSMNAIVKEVVWLPDGMRIALVAGKQMFILDAITGQIAVGPLRPDSSWIKSIGFSPDGHRIVYGAEDGTIGSWDALSGNLVLGPLPTHTDWVTSVAFSPDGNRLISGSDDKTICLWDARSGRRVLGPLSGHINRITSVAFSPDGTRIVSGSDDKTIRLWDAQTGQGVFGPLIGHTQRITSVAFSSDGTRFISGSFDGTICIWDTQSGQVLLGPIKGQTNGVTSVAFSPDSAYVASGSMDKTICLWDIQRGQAVPCLLEGHTQSVTSVAFSPDGSRIVSGSDDKSIRLWDARSRQILRSSPKGHTKPVTSVAFSPDGTRIASGSEDKTVCMWDAQSEQMILSPFEGHNHSVTSVAFSPDGTHIASGSYDKTIRMWDTQNGNTVLGPLIGHTEPVTSVVFSPSGAYLVTGSSDTTIRMWSARSGEAMLGPLKGHTSSVTSVAISPDGICIVSGSSDNTICIWDTRNGQILFRPLPYSAAPTNLYQRDESTPGRHRPLQGHSNHSPLGYSPPAGVYSRATRADLHHRDMPTLGGRNRGLDSSQPGQHTNQITSVAFSPKGTYIASGSSDMTICMWDIRSRQMVLGPLKGHTRSVTSIAFSPDGTRIVSSGDDMTIRVWDTRSGEIMLGPLKGHTYSVRSVAFSPDGTRIVSGACDNTILVWDARGQQAMWPAFNRSTPHHSGSANQVSLSSSSLTDPISWEVNADGWVVDSNSQSRLVACIPVDLLHVLLPPRNISRISTETYVSLNFDGVRIGSSWTKCYQPVYS